MVSILRHKIVTILIASIMLVAILGSIAQFAFSVDWSPDMRITWARDLDADPSIIQSGNGRMWVFWVSYRYGNPDLFYKTYNASAIHSWSPDVRLTNDSNEDLSPSAMQAQDGKIWVVWASNRTGNTDIYCKTFNGLGWSVDNSLVTNSSRDEGPTIAQSTNGTIWVVWSSNRDDMFNLFYKTSSDNGLNWSEEKQLTQSQVADQDRVPSIARAANNNLWLTWMRERNQRQIFYMVYNGTNWSNATQLTTDLSQNADPSVMQAQNGTVWVVWDSDRFGDPNPQNDIVYNTYNGTAWLPDDLRLTSDLYEDANPSVTQASDGLIWVAWTSNRAEASFDIYYKTNSVPSANDVSVFSVTPAATWVVQTKTLPIEVVSQNKGTASQTVTVKCYVGSSLVGTKSVNLAAGQLNVTNFVWNSTGSAIGTYQVWAEALPVSGETYTYDNVFYDDFVSVVVHDVAVKSLTFSQTVVPRPRILNISVGVKNEGNFTETLQVTVYWNGSVLDIRTVSDLAPHSELVFVVAWNTSGYAYQHYHIWAKAAAVVDEKNLANNTFDDGDVVTVTILGDADGDGAVGTLDLANVSANWYPGPPVGVDGYNLNSDFNADGSVDIIDAAIVNSNWLKTW